MKGELPWQGLKARNKEDKYQQIKERKVNTAIETLCLGYPEEMATYMQYCRNLGFDEKPNYAYLKSLFRDLYNKCQFEYDYIFDWTVQKFRTEPEIHSTNLLETQLDEEHKGRREETSTIPDSLKNNLGMGSEDAGVLGRSGAAGGRSSMGFDPNRRSGD